MASQLVRNRDAAAILYVIGSHPWISGRELKALLPEMDEAHMRGMIIRLSHHGLIERRTTGNQRVQWRVRG